MCSSSRGAALPAASGSEEAGIAVSMARDRKNVTAVGRRASYDISGEPMVPECNVRFCPGADAASNPECRAQAALAGGGHADRARDLVEPDPIERQAARRERRAERRADK